MKEALLHLLLPHIIIITITPTWRDNWCAGICQLLQAYINLIALKLMSLVIQYLPHISSVHIWSLLQAQSYALLKFSLNLEECRSGSVNSPVHLSIHCSNHWCTNSPVNAFQLHISWKFKPSMRMN